MFSATLFSSISLRALTTSPQLAFWLRCNHRFNISSFRRSFPWWSRSICNSSCVSRPRLIPNWCQSVTVFSSEERFPTFGTPEPCCRSRDLRIWAITHDGIRVNHRIAVNPMITTARTKKISIPPSHEVTSDIPDAITVCHNARGTCWSYEMHVIVTDRAQFRLRFRSAFLIGWVRVY